MRHTWGARGRWFESSRPDSPTNIQCRGYSLAGLLSLVVGGSVTGLFFFILTICDVKRSVMHGVSVSTSAPVTHDRTPSQADGSVLRAHNIGALPICSRPRAGTEHPLETSNHGSSVHIPVRSHQYHPSTTRPSMFARNGV